MTSPQPTTYRVSPSPLGDLLTVGGPAGISGMYLSAQRWAPAIDADWVRDDAAFPDVVAQMQEYLAGERTTFSVALDLRGTSFQLQVWERLRAIPYGQTRSYAELAVAVGRPRAFRAVGLANGRNPVSVIVPCHRVIGSGGSLTGYGGGLERKRALLALEGATLTLGAWGGAERAL